MIEAEIYDPETYDPLESVTNELEFLQLEVEKIWETLMDFKKCMEKMEKLTGCYFTL